jgi:metaxin
MNAPTTSPHWPKLPEPLRALFSHFPLYKYPPILPATATAPLTAPVLWILPPVSQDADAGKAHTRENLLSSDVECLKWQAYLAFRGLNDIGVRWDVHPAGAIDGRLPNLHLPASPAEVGAADKPKNASNGQLLASHAIPEWMETKVGALDELEGYLDASTRDESRAWVTLLEGHVHAALVSSSAVSAFTPLDNMNAYSSQLTQNR